MNYVKQAPSFLFFHPTDSIRLRTDTPIDIPSFNYMCASQAPGGIHVILCLFIVEIMTIIRIITSCLYYSVKGARVEEHSTLLAKSISSAPPVMVIISFAFSVFCL